MSNNEKDSLDLSSFGDENIKEIINSDNAEPQKTAFKISDILKNKKSMVVTVCVTLILALTLIFTLLIVNNTSSHDDDDEISDKGSKATYSTSTFKNDYKTTLSKEVKAALNTTSKDYLLLVNKSKPLGSSYIPSNLKTLDSNICTKASELDGAAAIAAEALVAEMWECGFTDIRVTSAYRSYARQEQLFEGYIADEMQKNPSLTKEQAKAIVLGYSAEAGYSEHQSGLCIDLINTKKMLGLYNYGSETSSSPYDLGFAEIEEYQWLLENAHKFGFILRYPEDKTNKTGYEYEAWHYRFVGIDAATKIYKQGITLEEYLK